MVESFLFTLEKIMNEGLKRSILLRVLLRAGVAGALTGALLMTGCARNQSTGSPPINAQQAEEPPVPPPPPPATPPAVAPIPQRNPASNTEAQSLEGSGRMAWAKGLAGYFIAGFDGGLYEPYRRATIESVQQSLRDRGLYAGPINGILDAPTMKALFTFQQATHNLQLCGVPTPRTRKMLEQGSHTDVTS